MILSAALKRRNHVAYAAEKVWSELVDAFFKYTPVTKQMNVCLQSTLKIKFIYKILRWNTSWKQNGKEYVTTATLQKSLFTGYRTKNNNELNYS
jgi:hypothetical protein